VGGCYKVGKTVQSSSNIRLGSLGQCATSGIGVKVVVIEVLNKSIILQEPCVFTRQFL
jgi:hypothetical protein